jgi:UDP-glucuronate decarboxylase
VNIGNPDEIPIRKIAEEVLELTGSRSKLVTRPLPQDDPASAGPTSRARKTLLKWTPKVERREGLQKTIA